MRRGKTVLATLASVSLIFGGVSAVTHAQISVPEVVIAEVQTGSNTSASQEFIELVNTTEQPVDVSEWRVEYFAANPKNFDTPTRTMPLHGSLPAKAHYLLASSGYLVGMANDSFSAGLAATGGHIRLVSIDPDRPTESIAHDLIGWGTAIRPEGAAALVLKAGESLQRKIDDSGRWVDTNNNAADFTVGAPSPEGFIPEPEAPDPEPAPTTDQPGDMPTDTTDSETPQDPTQAQPDPVQAALPPIPLLITELFPNPASPQTDAADEFIELYNPNDTVVELTGYKLQTGTTYNHSFEFNDQTIEAHSYKAFYVPETGVVLANSAGKARLIDPSGAVMSETLDYSDAPEGQSWDWDGATWQWSTTVTPGAENQVTSKPIEDKKTSTTTKKASSSSSKPKSSAAKVKTASAKVKSSKANGSGAGGTQIADTVPAKPAAIHPAVIAGVGGLALLYGVYEYRQDLGNAVQRFRSNRANRHAGRR